MKTKIPTVNYHLTKNCNMKCKFCYATFKDISEIRIDLKKSKAIIEQLAMYGFKKITFAGGEPTMIKGLDELMKYAKEKGMITCLVTNGSRLLNQDYCDKIFPYTDWLTLSIDSVNDQTNIESGRTLKGNVSLTKINYLQIIESAKRFSIRVKINTVVNQWNKEEDLNSFLVSAQPERWKILQAILVKGQNSNHTGEFEIKQAEFNSFISRHQKLTNLIDLIPEEEELIRGSYIMISPDGRFFDSTNGSHQYSMPILEVGIEQALDQISVSYSKFLKRGGLYNYSKQSDLPKKITLSGGVASGKTTIGKLLAKVLGYKFVSLGEETRSIAASQGIGILELQNERVKNPNIDIEIDALFSKACNQESEIVIDYRMGFKFIHNSFNILLRISEDAATKRLIEASRLKESYSTVSERNNLMTSHFFNLYQINFLDATHYHLTIDVEKFHSPEEIIYFILEQLNSLTLNK
jgi:radical S-adenosyl methionine domain-containing protein 2